MLASPQKDPSPARTERESFSSILHRIRSAYTPRKAKSDRHSSIVLRRFVRPISFYLAVPMVALGVKANQSTAIRIFINTLSAILLLSGSKALMMVAACFVALDLIWDCVDGNLARLEGTTFFGDVLDSLSDTYRGIVIPIGVAYGLYSFPDRILLGVIEPLYWKPALTIGCLFIITLRLFRGLVFYRVRFCELTKGKEIPRYIEAKWTLFYRCFSFISRTERNAFLFLLPFLVWGNVLSIYLINIAIMEFFRFGNQLRWAYSHTKYLDRAVQQDAGAHAHQSK